MTEAVHNRDVVLVWLPKGSEPTDEDYAKGEPWHDLDNAIIHAWESVRQDGKVPWIRCDQKFVLPPDDIAAAYPDVKGKG